MSQPIDSASTASPFQGAIGVFDSGVGGLSVLRAIHAALPHEHLVYVADSGHAPYGDQSEAHITQRTLTVGNWLAKQGVKSITIACNTATVVAAKTLREQTHLPVVAIEPAIKPAVALTRSGVVGVLATRQTVQSASVARLVDLYASDKRILLQGCPGLVEQVERADLHSAETEALLRQLIKPLLEQGADTLVLGCTHYPFLRETIQRIAGEGVMLLDPAEAVARELARRLAENGCLSDAAVQGRVQFFTSGDVAQAQAVMSHLWDAPLTVQALP
ncbi:glutamate racemase [Limnohabitans sp.]|uniref:glutamate racemase n=1 Tax=Limnohabitans sp. TaxID=1907725 RepID=UPI00286EF7DD|nr:glutamate racemase [Limnohabitans sp.]